MYIVKVQAVFRGQSLRRRLARVDPLALPMSHFKDYRQKRNKQGLYCKEERHCLIPMSNEDKNTPSH